MICLLCVSCSYSNDIDRETLEVVRRLDTWTGILEDKSPVYAKGEENEKFADCSGALWYIFHKSGLPYPRTTAFKMWIVWSGIEIKDKLKRKFPHLQWFSFKKPRDHISIVRFRDKKGTWYSHASWGKQQFVRSYMKDSSSTDQDVSGIKEIDLTPGTK